MRLGFAVKVLGNPNIKPNDTRRWQSEPHLSVSIGYLREVFEYLDDNNIRMYRMSSELAPYVTHPEMPQFHTQIEDCLDELAELGETAREYSLRLSLHPSQYIVLNSPDEGIAAAAVRDCLAQSMILDAMGLDREAVVVLHTGGVYGDKEAAKERFMRRYEILPENVKHRLVLENDETSFSTTDVLEISRNVGITVVWDYLHHQINNREGMSIREAVEYSFDTWPEGCTPKIHFSSPRTELREIKKKNPITGKAEVELEPPLISQHADYINPFEFLSFVREVEGIRDFDVMVEAKAKDLALLRLREHARTYSNGRVILE